MTRLAKFTALALVVFYSAAPMLWQLATSLKPADELTTLPPLLPSEPTLVHYTAVFTGHPFLGMIANSFVVALATTLLALGVGSAAAFALATLEVPRKSWILAAVLAVSMFPPIATVSPLFLFVNAIGLRDTLAALILTYTTFSLPLAVWLLYNFFRSVPYEVYLASRVDGCTTFQSFVWVMLPLASSGLFATALLVFIFSWNEFLLALTLTATPASRTVPVAIALFPGLHEIPYGEIAAASMVVTAPLLALALVFHRSIVEGLTAGAVKG